MNERKLAEYLARHGKMLLPMLELIEQIRMAVDDLVDVIGQASIEAECEPRSRLRRAPAVAGAPVRRAAPVDHLPRRHALRRTRACWPLWASMSRAGNTCWPCWRVPPRRQRPLKTYFSIWCRRLWIRRAGACFVIDASKTFRAAISAVFGQAHPIQRCRNHKLRDVLRRLPREQQAHVRPAPNCDKLILRGDLRAALP